jgi:hypothetical protein
MKIANARFEPNLISKRELACYQQLAEAAAVYAMTTAIC